MDGKPAKNPGGRPSKYSKQLAKLAYQLCRLHGYTDEKLATVLDVGISTLKRWKDEHPEFRAQVQQGKDEFDCEQVESALLKRAKGFVRKRVSKRTFTVGRAQRTETTETIEEVAGSVDAEKFWLSRRNPQRWPWKQEEDQEDQEQTQQMGPLVVPADEDIDEWLRTRGVDPNRQDLSGPDGGPTQGGSGSS